jgi:Kef-type K+ transport system membrane component KefB
MLNVCSKTWALPFVLEQICGVDPMDEEHVGTLFSQGKSVSRRRLVFGYLVMVATAVGLFALVRVFGEARFAVQPLPVPVETSRGGLGTDAFFHVLLALAAIVVLSRGLGRVFALIGQPRVIGEVVAGIVLGPSLLGHVAPTAMAFILPATAAPLLAVIAQLGVILYMFLVGLELNAGLLRSRAHATVAISHASIVVPFLLGAVLALWLYPRLAPGGVRFTSFALFMGVAMAITAFPVLARILTDRRMEKTELGVVALSCAAADDVTAWCLLAFMVGLAKADVADAMWTVLLSLGYIAVMFAIVRPVAIRTLSVDHEEHLSPGVVSWVLVALLISALITEAIGIHAIFGAFLLGAIIPHDSAVARLFTHKLEDVVTILLLPAFFAYTGMRMQIGLIAGAEGWLICAVIIALATIGKFGGTLAAARFTGLDWRTSASLGILMNTRGLMELIVLNIGLDLGIISPTLFAMMVLMALATTLATTPVLQRLNPDSVVPGVSNSPGYESRNNELDPKQAKAEGLRW